MPGKHSGKYPPLTYAFTSDVDIELARFKGMPGKMSPKARLWMLAGWLLPSYFK
jgi:hypothetical protein